MMAQNILITLIGLVAVVQAGPCKPSPSTTVTGTASTDTSLATISNDVTTTSTVTSGVLITTTETAPATTTTTGPELTYSCPGGFPSHSSCGIRYNHNRSNGYIVGTAGAGSIAANSLDVCLQACTEHANCDFFAFWPGQLCELWSGRYEYDSNSNMGASSWYELSCFCVPGRETTPTVATTTEATTTVATTTEATTTVAATNACVNTEKRPSPTDVICNSHGLYSGTNVAFLGAPPNAKTMESCRKACHDDGSCTFFAFTPGQACWIYSGTIDSVNDQQTEYIWYDMDCFCDMDEQPTSTTIEATATGTSADTATMTYTAPGE
ncbi:hypothetical protein FSPOR_4122 [Fusarium sporotrichioides]|uniref:Apple domain-containing protein n=1 Tax=Fusarium sporotrichioides TaxID=5514 RepID=A0A395SDT1_FUSSP|nr:hypothetical protein FSPOR_4122 [Fusarium sporotrichioides]